MQATFFKGKGGGLQETRMTNDEVRTAGFGIRTSPLIRISGFGLRILPRAVSELLSTHGCFGHQARISVRENGDTAIVFRRCSSTALDGDRGSLGGDFEFVVLEVIQRLRRFERDDLAIRLPADLRAGMVACRRSQ